MIRVVTSDLWTADAPLAWLAMKIVHGALDQEITSLPPRRGGQAEVAGHDLHPHSLLEDSLVEKAAPSLKAKHTRAFWLGHVTWNLCESFGWTSIESKDPDLVDTYWTKTSHMPLEVLFESNLLLSIILHIFVMSEGISVQTGTARNYAINCTRVYLQS